MSNEVQEQLLALDTLTRQYERAFNVAGSSLHSRTSDGGDLGQQVQSLASRIQNLTELQARRTKEDAADKRLRRRALRAMYNLSVVRVPRSTDAFGADPDFEKAVRPIIDFLYELYWRIEVSGIENIPLHGNGILVANHAGLLPFDALMLQHAVRRNHSGSRNVRVLVEDWFYRRPLLSILMSRLGCVPARPANAQRVLRDDNLVAVFPEGTHGVLKPYRQRYKVQRFGRGGSIRLARNSGAPLIPVAILGSEEIYPLIFESKKLAKMLGLSVFPVTPTFPAAGPIGLMPLPSAWTIRFGEQFVPELPSDDHETYDLAVHDQNEQLRETVQNLVSESYMQRRSSFFR